LLVPRVGTSVPTALQAAVVLACGDTDEHLLHDPTIQRIGVDERMKCRQRDFFAVGPDPRPADLDFPTAENDLTRDCPGPRDAAEPAIDEEP
jgi:hypothetical protein